MSKGRKEKWGGINDGTQGVRDDQEWRRSVEQLAAESGLGGPNYVGVRQGGSGTYTSERSGRARTDQAGAEWNMAREEDSLGHVESLLSQVAFCVGGAAAPIVAGYRRSESFSEEDRAGTDLEVAFSAEFAEFCGLSKVGIQVKSSETGVEAFATKGKTKYGSTGAEWLRQSRILLDGQWVDGSIVADFVVQLMNLMGIYQNEEEMRDFLSCLDDATRTMYGHAFLQIEQYRGEMLEWIRCMPHRENGGKTVIY